MHFTQFLTGRKHGHHSEDWDTEFTVHSRNESYKNAAKIVQKIHGQTSERSHPPPIRHWLLGMNFRVCCHMVRVTMPIATVRCVALIKAHFH